MKDTKMYKVATSDYLQRAEWYKSLSHNQNETYNAEYVIDILKKYLNKKEYQEACFKNRWIKIEDK